MTYDLPHVLAGSGNVLDGTVVCDDDVLPKK